MKKFSFLVAIAAIVACVSMTSCKKNENLAAEQPEQDFYTVQLGWDGEILDVQYEPLRSSSTDDLYGIQVYSTPDKELNEGESTTWTPYAYGLFDNADNISVNLLVGYKYKFVATMVKDGKNKLNGSSTGYYQPFELVNRTIYVKPTNTFEYRTDLYFIRLDYGMSYLKKDVYQRPNTERYYGELENYIPGENGSKAKIHMKRTSFGAKFIAKGKLANSGNLQILINSAPEMNIDLSAGEKQVSDIFTFSNVKEAWANNQYSEAIPVTFNWIRTDGTTLPLGTHDITYKRNATTVVHINIENDGENSGVGFEYSDEDLGEMPEDPDTETTITDGEVVDTEVDTNGSSESSNTIPNNQIWYTATAKVEPYASADFGATIVSNEWDSTTGKGVISFDGEVVTIGNSAFSGKNNLTSITIPNSVTFIEKKAFANCSNITEIIFPDGLTSIGDEAFDSCNGFTSITIPNSVKEVGNRAFHNCDNLTVVTVGDGITTIGNEAFSYADQLQEFRGDFASNDGRCLIVGGVLVSFAFSGLSSSEYSIPNNVTKIGYRAFYECNVDGLTDIIIPNSVTVIGEESFSCCRKLTNILIPNSVNIIEYGAFEYCSNIASITIPNSINSIGKNAFSSCTKLKTVYCKPIIPPTADISFWGAFDYNDSNRKIYVLSTSIDSYKAAYGWKDYANYIFADSTEN